MLKKIMYQKIIVASSILFVITMLYLMPVNKKESTNIEQKLEYIYPNNLEVIYLLDNNDYLSMTKINVNKTNEITKATDLIEGLTNNGKRKDIMPTGFRGLLPEGTKLLDIKLNDRILTINFSKDFNNIEEKYENKLIESLVYTLTSIDGIDKIEIYIENEKLTELPNSKTKLPTYLDRSYGINKKYEITTLSDIDSYTVYYVFNYNDETYYTPVTKYINNKNQDKVRIIIDELATSMIYESNLMSYLNTNAKLLDYEITDKIIKLNFNDLIISDITNNQILEEVMYTIGLSLHDELNIQDIIFQVNGNEISTFSLKTLD